MLYKGKIRHGFPSYLNSEEKQNDSIKYVEEEGKRGEGLSRNHSGHKATSLVLKIARILNMFLKLYPLYISKPV
jgi:hypothetical protein